MNSIYDFVTVGSAVLVVFLVLIQTRGASLGAGLGGGGEVETVRRGADKTIHQITIAAVFVFCSSLIIGFLV